MFAIEMAEFGGPEVLRYCEVEDPVLRAGEVLVRILACSVNPADVKVRQGDAHYVERRQLPLIPGRDLAGCVVAKSPDVADFDIGDEICVVTGRGREGCYASCIAIDAALCARKPPELAFVTAAAVCLPGLTAMAAVRTAGEIAKGTEVLIVGAAGSVGAYLLQYAVSRDARVTAA